MENGEYAAEKIFPGTIGKPEFILRIQMMCLDHHFIKLRVYRHQADRSDDHPASVIHSDDHIDHMLTLKIRLRTVLPSIAKQQPKEIRIPHYRILIIIQYAIFLQNIAIFIKYADDRPKLKNKLSKQIIQVNGITDTVIYIKHKQSFPSF